MGVAATLPERSEWTLSKHDMHLVSFDPDNFGMSKYIKGIFNPDAVWHSYFLILWQSFTEKERNRYRKCFSSSENAIWSILLKYQEIDVQIQTFTDEN